MSCPAPLRTVAALYIDPRGPYPKLPGVDCWDETRDARLYAGPHSVVAHPPCGPWGRLKHLYRGDEHDCALIAQQQVRAHGGVLEHPAHSDLWKACALLLPGDSDLLGGFTLEVDQCAWGHVARKRTWLYFCGIDRTAVIPRAGSTPTHWVSGFMKAGSKGKPPPGIKICSSTQRRRTPIAFAEWLVALARLAQ
jgi:hypothetical protein